MSVEATPGAGGSLLLEQEISYVYEQPVRGLRQRLMVLPRPAHGRQRRVDFGLSVSDPGAVVEFSTDRFSNCVAHIEVASVPERIAFSTWALVTSEPERSTPEPRQPEHLVATELTRAGEALAEVGRTLAITPGGVVAIGEAASAWTSRAMTYEWGVTSVRTTADEALAGGRGVCQDYAHIMLAICRAAGVPARYVSGHLVGEGGSHAWVEVLDTTPTGGSSAVGFDPTHDRRVDDRYLALAVGRDYLDVSPTSGTFHGACPGRLDVRKRLRAVTADEVTALRDLVGGAPDYGLAAMSNSSAASTWRCSRTSG